MCACVVFVCVCDSHSLDSIADSSSVSNFLFQINSSLVSFVIIYFGFINLLLFDDAVVDGSVAKNLRHF